MTNGGARGGRVSWRVSAAASIQAPGKSAMMTLALRRTRGGLLVHSAMLRSSHGIAQSAFLIDSDFFRESPRYELSNASIPENLEALHSNADALFRRCITEVLHHALGPKES